MFQQPIRHHRTGRVRLFYALRPPRETAARTLAAHPVAGDKGLAPGRVHMTLFLLDDRERLETPLVDTLLAIGAAVRSAPVAVRLERLIVSGGWSALVPGQAAPALVALHRRIAGHARAAGIGAMPGHAFAPHVTLGYGPALRPAGPVEPVGWTADELLLIHSQLGATRHAVLGRWPLLAQANPQLALF